MYTGGWLPLWGTITSQRQKGVRPTPHLVLQVHPMTTPLQAAHHSCVNCSISNSFDLSTTPRWAILLLALMKGTEAWGPQGNSPGLLNPVGIWGLVFTLWLIWEGHGLWLVFGSVGGLSLLNSVG